LRQQAFLDRLERGIAFSLDAASRISADKVSSRFETCAHAFFHGLREVMTAKDVGNRAAVGDYVSRKSPIAPQMFVEQRGVCAGGLAIERVIGAHHRLRFTLDD